MTNFRVNFNRIVHLGCGCCSELERDFELFETLEQALSEARELSEDCSGAVDVINRETGELIATFEDGERD